MAEMADFTLKRKGFKVLRRHGRNHKTGQKWIDPPILRVVPEQFLQQGTNAFNNLAQLAGILASGRCQGLLPASAAPDQGSDLLLDQGSGIQSLFAGNRFIEQQHDAGLAFNTGSQDYNGFGKFLPELEG